MVTQLSENFNFIDYDVVGDSVLCYKNHKLYRKHIIGSNNIIYDTIENLKFLCENLEKTFIEIENNISAINISYFENRIFRYIKNDNNLSSKIRNEWLRIFRISHSFDPIFEKTKYSERERNLLYLCDGDSVFKFCLTKLRISITNNIILNIPEKFYIYSTILYVLIKHFKSKNDKMFYQEDTLKYGFDDNIVYFHQLIPHVDFSIFLEAYTKNDNEKFIKFIK